MIIVCEKCKTRYKVADDIIDKPAFRVRCSKCSNRFMVYRDTVQEKSLLLQDVVQPDHNRIISVSNQKGGVAKTSTCLNLGMALAEMGKRVLLIDFDVQANLTILLGFRKTKSFYEILESDTKNLSAVIEKTRYPSLYLLPSNSKMALLKKKYLHKHNYEYLLKNRLDLIKDKFDHILIDTPPSIEFFTLNALVASNLVIMPTKCEYLSMHGINQITDILSVVKNGINPDVHYKVLLTMLDEGNTSEKVMYSKIQEKFGEHVFNTVIELDAKMPESHIVNMPVVHYDKESKSALQFKNLATELTGDCL